MKQNLFTKVIKNAKLWELGWEILGYINGKQWGANVKVKLQNCFN
jgi:hypothetical protein